MFKSHANPIPQRPSKKRRWQCSFPLTILWPSVDRELVYGREGNWSLAITLTVYGCSEKKETGKPGGSLLWHNRSALKDPLILAKLQFYTTVVRTFNLFLKRYQTDEPSMPFFCKFLAELIKVMIYMESTPHGIATFLSLQLRLNQLTCSLCY